MALFPQMERVFWFDGRLKRHRYPNAARLAERFEVSGKTARRDTALMRDRLMAPIEYDSQWIGNWLPIDEIGY
jgi:predicted DNA-binding transcriptional regulator YafY